jgi:hypothetical protein
MDCFVIFFTLNIKMSNIFFNIFELTCVTRDPAPQPGQHPNRI